MKQIALIALTFVLAGCLMTGCRRNDMMDSTGTDGMGGNTTITTTPNVTTLPTTGGRPNENTGATTPGNGGNGIEDPVARGRIHGSAQ